MSRAILLAAMTVVLSLVLNYYFKIVGWCFDKVVQVYKKITVKTCKHCNGKGFDFDSGCACPWCNPGGSFSGRL
jgi:hypothetical protein